MYHYCDGHKHLTHVIITIMFQVNIIFYLSQIIEISIWGRVKHYSWYDTIIAITCLYQKRIQWQTLHRGHHSLTFEKASLYILLFSKYLTNFSIFLRNLTILTNPPPSPWSFPDDPTCHGAVKWYISGNGTLFTINISDRHHLSINYNWGLQCSIT